MDQEVNTFDPLVIDTSPGAQAVSPFAPPAGFAGGAGDYLSLLRFRCRLGDHLERFESHVQAYQDGQPIQFTGPFIAEAMLVLSKLMASNLKQKAG